MKLPTDKLGLVAFAVVMVMAFLGSRNPQTGPGVDEPISVRRPAISQPADDWRGLRQFSITIGEKVDSSGTAFSLGGGWWMTARHVVDGCDAVGILRAPDRGIRAAEVAIHRAADVAMIATDRAGPPVRIADQAPMPGDAAYHVGFPRGKPGEVRSELIGTQVMRVSGRYSTREPVLAWAEVERIPDDPSPLSGLSGGPVFDAQGRLVGVHVAGSVRRGRSYTAHPSSIAGLMADRQVRAASRGADVRFSPSSFIDVADRLRADWTVAKAVCDVR